MEHNSNMGGGLLQLVSYGAQDIYISGNPQITFWKVLFKRHTNFAMESIEVTFNGQADFNKRVTAIINRNADLMYRTYVQVVLPAVDLSASSSVATYVKRFRWLNYVGHRLIKTVELEIGGQLGGGASTVVVPTTSDGPSGPYLPGLGITQGPSLQGSSWLDTGGDVSNQSALFEDTTNYLLAKVLLDSGIKCSGKNPIEVAKLQLNGQDRFTEREGRYFNFVQPYQHHTRTPTVGINVYSFALKPEEHQPSGSCNFSRIDKATLQLTVSVNTVRSGRTAQVRVYAVNYNVLRVMSGMGGLAYSN